MPSKLKSRLLNPEYYEPILIDKLERKAYYSITPKIKPIFSDWITKELPRNERYYSKTLTANFLEHHTIIKDNKVNNHEVLVFNGFTESYDPTSLHSSFEKLDKLTIGLVPFDDSFKFQVETYPLPQKTNLVPFRYVKVSDPPKDIIFKTLSEILVDAHTNDVDILIFPELTVDHNTLTYIQKWLRDNNDISKIKLIVSGSFHKERTEGGFTNTSIMLDWEGIPIWEHQKMSPFSLPHHVIEKSPNKEL